MDVHGKLPIEDGTDVINVRGLSFRRFLDLARPLQKTTTVVTDNDGKEAAVVAAAYGSYTSETFISVKVGEDKALKTLEPQLLAANDRNTLNAIFQTTHADDVALLHYMWRPTRPPVAFMIFSSKTDQHARVHPRCRHLKTWPSLRPRGLTKLSSW